MRNFFISKGEEEMRMARSVVSRLRTLQVAKCENALVIGASFPSLYAAQNGNSGHDYDRTFSRDSGHKFCLETHFDAVAVQTAYLPAHRQLRIRQSVNNGELFDQFGYEKRPRPVGRVEQATGQFKDALDAARRSNVQLI